MERFWEKVDKSPGHGPNGDCWIWTAAIYSNAIKYGGFRLNGKTKLAHRVAYELQKGPIPDKLLVCHKCDNRLCVRGDHLFVGTHKDNYQDSIDKGTIVHIRDHPNYREGAKPPRFPCGTSASYKKGCRCSECKSARSIKRKENYRKYGC